MRNIKQAEVTAEDLAKQSVGCLFSAFIRQGHRIDFARDDALEQFVNLCIMQIMLWWEAHQTDAVKIQSFKELKYNAKNPEDIQNQLKAA